MYVKDRTVEYSTVPYVCLWAYVVCVCACSLAFLHLVIHCHLYFLILSTLWESKCIKMWNSVRQR